VRLHREVTVELPVKVAAEGDMIVGHLTPEQEAEVAKQRADATQEENSGTSE
jgi:hypothetical protein